MDSIQRTEPVTCAVRLERISPSEETGCAVKFAMTPRGEVSSSLSGPVMVVVSSSAASFYWADAIRREW